MWPHGVLLNFVHLEKTAVAKRQIWIVGAWQTRIMHCFIKTNLYTLHMQSKEIYNWFLRYTKATQQGLSIFRKATDVPEIPFTK